MSKPKVIRLDLKKMQRPIVKNKTTAAKLGVPRISKLMALAIRFEELVNTDQVTDYAEIARLGCITSARLTQIMSLRMLAPDIQEQLLNLNSTSTGREPITERNLRPIVGRPDWVEQRQMWQEMQLSCHA